MPERKPKKTSTVSSTAVKLADNASVQNKTSGQTPNSSGDKTRKRRVRKVAATKTATPAKRPVASPPPAPDDTLLKPLPAGGIRELIGNVAFGDKNVGAIVLSSPTCGEGKIFLDGKLLYAAEKNKYVPPILLRMRTEGALNLSEATKMKHVPLKELEATLLRDYPNIHPLYFDMLKQQLIFSTLSSFVTWEEEGDVSWGWRPGEKTSLLTCKELERPMALLAVEERLGQWTILERNYPQSTESDAVPRRGAEWSSFSDEEIYSASFTHVVRKVNGKTTVRLLAKRSGLTPFEVASILAKAVNDDIVTFEEEPEKEYVDAAESIEEDDKEQTADTTAVDEDEPGNGIFPSVEVEENKPSAKDFISEEDETAAKPSPHEEDPPPIVTESSDVAADGEEQDEKGKDFSSVPLPEGIGDVEIEYVEYEDAAKDAESAGTAGTPAESSFSSAPEVTGIAQTPESFFAGDSAADVHSLFFDEPHISGKENSTSTETLKKVAQDTLKMLADEKTKLEKALQYNAYIGGVIESRLSSVNAGIDMILESEGF